MLIKDQIKNIVLNQLKKIYVDLPVTSYIHIDWDKVTDDFEGSIDFCDANNRSYDFCVEYENNKFELVWIKETKIQCSKNLIYSIDREKKYGNEKN